MDDVKLIQLIRIYPALYNSSHNKYMDSSYKSEVWNVIGKEMELEGPLCKARWNNIRDNYRKSLKKTTYECSSGASESKHYRFSEELSFLKEYLDVNRTKVRIGTQRNSEVKEASQKRKSDANETVPQRFSNLEETGSQRYNSVEDTSPQRCRNMEETGSQYNSETEEIIVPDEVTRDLTRHLQLQKQSSRSVKRKKLSENLVVLKKIHRPASPKPLDLCSRNDHQPIANSNLPTHPVDAFLAGISPILKTLTPYYLNVARSEIFASVQRCEMEMLLGQNVAQKPRFGVDMLYSSNNNSPS